MIDNPHQDEDEFPPADYVARVTAALPAAIAAHVDRLIGLLADTRAGERIISAWRAGLITDEKAALLLQECGFDRVLH